MMEDDCSKVYFMCSQANNVQGTYINSVQKSNDYNNNDGIKSSDKDSNILDEKNNRIKSNSRNNNVTDKNNCSNNIIEITDNYRRGDKNNIKTTNNHHSITDNCSEINSDKDRNKSSSKNIKSTDNHHNIIDNNNDIISENERTLLVINTGEKDTTIANNLTDDHIRELDVDDFLHEVGGFGVAQKAILLLLYLMMLPHSFHTLSWHFTGQSPPWKCTHNNKECNVTWVLDLGDETYERRCQMERGSWKFLEESSFSIVTEWDLVCEKKEYPYLVTSLMWIGWALGAFVFGFISDKYGRRRTLYLSWSLLVLASLACAFVRWFWVYVALAFTVGCAQGGVALTIYILASELVTPKYKSLTSGTGTGLTYTISLCLLSLQAWVTKNWRLFMIITTAPYLFLLLFYKFMPESIRWLRLNGRSQEAESILKNVCKINKKKWPNNTRLQSPDDSKVEEDSLRDLFSGKIVTLNMAVMMFIWFVIGQVYFGISMASDQLSGNIYRDFALTSLVGIPGNLLVVLLTNRFGRKPTLMVSLGTGSLACFVIAFVHPSSAYVWIRITCGMIGQLCMALSFSSMYSWSMELMPTSVRSQGMGILSVVTRFGGSTAPWVAQWFEHMHWMLPFAVMSAFALLSSLACSRLPETKDVPTIETIQQLNRFIRCERKYNKTASNDDVMFM